MTVVKVLDGGFSAQLSKYVGAKIDGDPLWTARFLSTDPDAIYKTHLDFLRAGADIIETNTYQASVPGLMEHLCTTEAESIALLCKAVKLARNAVHDYMTEIEGRTNVGNNMPLIAGSCGPYGASLHDGSEYSGAYGKTTSKKTIMDWHRPRVKALLIAGADILAFETIPCYQEAEALVELLKEFPGAKAWLSFSSQRNTQKIADGSDFQEVATQCYRTAPAGQIIAIGVNCLAPKDVTPLLKGINQNEKNEFIPLIAYPNSGEIYSATEGWVKDENSCSFETFIPEWIELGVRYLGGCCRMYADNIKSIRRQINKIHKTKTVL